jgi:hypothetical protein
MLTDPKLKSQVDQLWDKLWTGGLSIAVKKTVLTFGPGRKTRMGVSLRESFVKPREGGYTHEYQNTGFAPNRQSHAAALAGSLSAG